MSKAAEGCLICGATIEYLEKSELMKCEICNDEFQTRTICSKGHYVCDSCHQNKGFDDIIKVMLSSEKTNPIEIADEMMLMASVHMHGPEHHFLVAASLLSAYVNLENINDSNKQKNDIIVMAEERARLVPGGICGFWGSCGAAIGAGIFISIITEANPYTIDSWSKSNLMVSNALKVISENGGPRCCKRNTYLAIISAVNFLRLEMNIYLELPKEIKCSYHNRNDECKHEECKFYPV